MLKIFKKKPKPKPQSRLPYFVLLTFLIVVAVSVGEIIAYEHGSASGQGQQIYATFQRDTIAAKVESFYDGYILNTVSQPRNTFEGISLTPELQSSILASTAAIDPVYCSKTAPRLVRVGTPNTYVSPAQVRVDAYGTDGSDQAMMLSVRLSDNLITAIDCLN